MPVIELLKYLYMTFTDFIFVITFTVVIKVINIFIGLVGEIPTTKQP